LRKENYDRFVARTRKKIQKGNRLSVRFCSDACQTPTYDVLGQLIDEQHPDLGPTGTQYHYDANGNRTQVVRGSLTEWYGVDNADKLLWTHTTATGLAKPGAPTSGQASGYSLYGYDAFGQTVARDRRGRDGQRHAFDFRWDADGRLREVRENGATALSAQYAADGERITKTDAAGSHVNSFRLHDSVGAGTTYTPGFAERKGAQDRFTSTDHLGSTRYLTDESGATPTAALRYDAYGLRSASGGTDPTHPTDHQYAGAWGYEREETAGLGLDYLHDRYYDADAGRFVSRDPIGVSGGINLFAYTGNDPVNLIDPSGRSGQGTTGVPAPPTTDPWGRPLQSVKPPFWDVKTAQYHTPHYDVDIQVGGGTRSYRYYPQPNGTWRVIEKGIEATDTSGGTIVQRMTRLEAIRGRIFRSLWDRGAQRLRSLFPQRPQYQEACKRAGWRVGPRGTGRDPVTASRLSSRSAGSGGGVGAFVTIGYGLGVGAEAATHGLRWRKRTERALATAMDSDAPDPDGGF